jgi:hypothetical protein
VSEQETFPYEYVRKNLASGALANPWSGESESMVALTKAGLPGLPFVARANGAVLCMCFAVELDVNQKTALDTAYTNWDPDHVDPV